MIDVKIEYGQITIRNITGNLRTTTIDIVMLTRCIYDLISKDNKKAAEKYKEAIQGLIANEAWMPEEEINRVLGEKTKEILDKIKEGWNK